MKHLPDALLEVFEAGRPETYQHGLEVAKLAGSIAQGLGLPQEEIDFLMLCGLVHDIGYLGVPAEIVNSDTPRTLTENNHEWLRAHAIIGASLLENTLGLEACAPTVRWHHEHIDGSGYPDGLRGMEIPQHARIIAVAEAFSVMVGGRPYRQPQSALGAVQEICRLAGKQYDPLAANALAHVWFAQFGGLPN